MSGVNFEVATDFDKAWFNFELDILLSDVGKSDPNVGEFNNPFYVNRPNNQTDNLIDALLAPFSDPPKFFFSGHRGTGKTTELQRIASHPLIKTRFWPVVFSIRAEADYDIDIQGFLLAIGSQLFRSYKKEGYKLPPKLIKSLEDLNGKVEIEVKKVSERTSEFNVNAGLDALFANTSLSMKLEPKNRRVIKQTLKPLKNEFLKIVNDICVAIYEKTGRTPLVLIDDLDKLEAGAAGNIVDRDVDLLLTLKCSLIVVLSSYFLYRREYVDIKERSFVLTPIKLFDHETSSGLDTEGYRCMDTFITKRMSEELVARDVRMLAIKYCGGVNRELARIMRTAIGRARRKNAKQVEIDDIEWSATEIRNDYKRILDEKDMTILSNFIQAKDLKDIYKFPGLSPLLQLLALLNYVDKKNKNWYQCHPVLVDLLSSINEDVNRQIFNEFPDSISVESASENKSILDKIKTTDLKKEDEEPNKSHLVYNNKITNTAAQSNNVIILNELGDVYFRAKSYNEAISAYSKAIERDRDSAIAYRNLAKVYKKIGRYSEAILLLQRSVELSKTDQEKAISWNRLGDIYRRIDDYDNAISAYQRADELDPDITDIDMTFS